MNSLGTCDGWPEGAANTGGGSVGTGIIGGAGGVAGCGMLEWLGAGGTAPKLGAGGEAPKLGAGGTDGARGISGAGGATGACIDGIGIAPSRGCGMTGAGGGGTGGATGGTTTGRGSGARAVDALIIPVALADPGAGAVGGSTLAIGTKG